jgi:hypothetical protein
LTVLLAKLEPPPYTAVIELVPGVNANIVKGSRAAVQSSRSKRHFAFHERDGLSIRRRMNFSRFEYSIFLSCDSPTVVGAEFSKSPDIGVAFPAWMQPTLADARTNVNVNDKTIA